MFSNKVCLIIFLVIFQLGKAYGIEPYNRLTTVKPPESPLPNTWGVYKTDEYTGSFTYQYPISIPDGLNGLTPTISVNYNSHLSRSMPNWIGAGWDLNAHAFVQRDINFSRKDISDDKYELYWFGKKFDLVETIIGSSSNVQYFVTSYGENFTKIKRSRVSGDDDLIYRWLVETVEGKRYRFDEQHKINSTDINVNYPWRWSLSEISNSTANGIRYSYLTSPDLHDEGVIYLDEIEYLDKVIKFEYEPRPDSYEYIYQGSETKYASRLKAIALYRKNADIAYAKYEFSYRLNESKSKSLLAKIVNLGSSAIANDHSELVTKFNYSIMDKTFEPEFHWDARASVDSRPLRGTKENSNDLVIDIVDITGDGLPDFLLQKDSDDPWTIYENINGEEFSIPVHSGDWSNVTRAIREVKRGGDMFGLLTDLNKDGYLDYMRYAGNDIISVFYNEEGQGWSAEDTDTWERPNGSEIDFREIRVSGQDVFVEQDLIDLNGDGYPDLVKASTNEIFVWRGSSTGFQERETWDFPEDHIGFTDNGDLEQGFSDINGDGLPDFVDGGSSNWFVYLNTGSGFLSSVQVESEKFIISATSEGHVTKQLMDINGDGLPDYVDGGSRDVKVRLNSGSSFSDEVIWLVEGDRLSSSRIRETDNFGDGVNRDYIDMNGDNLPDVVEKYDEGTSVRFNNAIGFDLLTSITTPYGGETKINYSSSRDFENIRLPFSQMVVTEVQEDNKMSNAHEVKATQTYNYSGGLYDFDEMSFRGFSEVSIISGDLKKESYQFYQDDQKKGNPASYYIEDLDVEVELKSQEYFYDVEKNTSADENVFFIFPEKTIEKYFDVDAPIEITTKFKADSRGNLIEEEYLGTNISGDERFIKRSFSEGSNRVCLETISRTKNSQPFRVVENYYNDKNIHCDQDNFDNLLTKQVVKDSVNDSGYEYLWAFDSRGRITSSTDSNGHATSYSYDNSQRVKPSEITTETSSSTHLTIRSFDFFDNVISEINPAGFETKYTFDKFYRPLKVILPYDTELDPTVLWQYDIDGVAPEGIIRSKKYSPSKGSAFQYSSEYIFLDGFGRVIQEKAPFSGQVNSQVVENTYYDSLNRVSKIDNPKVFGESETYDSSSVSPSRFGTSFYYDAYDRLVRTLDPEGHESFNSYKGLDIGTQLKAATSDVLVPKKQYKFDPYNQLIELSEFDTDGDDLKKTRYTYSPLGNLLSITDQADNIWIYEYDQFSNLIRYTDPDRGMHHFEYDGEGNQLSHTDPKEVTVTRSYDELNRLILINYPSDFDAVLEYDQGKVGTLSSATNQLGKTTYSYDDRLRKIEETTELDGFSWATSWSYDSSDNVLEMVDPADTSTLYSYGNDTRLKMISGIADGIQYSPLGQYSSIQYSNGSSVDRLFNNQTLKLEAIQSRLPSINTVEKRYSFDVTGNISQINDSQYGVTNYGYDNLSQLVSENKIGRGLTTYMYDSLGNIQSVDGNGRNDFYTHDQSKIHQITILESVPTVEYLIINSGQTVTTSQNIVLNILASGEPTEMMISDNSGFSGTDWKAFNNEFDYSFNGFGNKILYVKVRNGQGTSEVENTSINVVNNDADNDGVEDSQDNCPNIPNANQNDLDNDSIGDVCDSDVDGDGIPNLWEVENGLDPNNADDARQDFDGDGYSNLEEFKGRSDPRDATSIPKSIDFLPAIYDMLLGIIKSIFGQNELNETLAAQGR